MGETSVDQLRAHYRNLLESGDDAQRELATEQLARLDDCANRPAPSDLPPSDASAGVDLVTLIEQTIGPLQRRPSGAMVGRCLWHSSRSGTCLVVWPDEGRWWCSSCRRGGDAARWVM